MKLALRRAVMKRSILRTVSLPPNWNHAGTPHWKGSVSWRKALQTQEVEPSHLPLPIETHCCLWLKICRQYGMLRKPTCV